MEQRGCIYNLVGDVVQIINEGCMMDTGVSVAMTELCGDSTSGCPASKEINNKWLGVYFAQYQSCW